MKQGWIVAAMLLTGASAPAGVRMLDGGDAEWAKTPLGMMGATALKSGAEGGPLYVFRVRYAKGERSPVHRHPDARVVTVMRGAIEVGGPTMRTGDSFLIPANTPHYGWARTQAAELQEVGSGATGTMILP